MIRDRVIADVNALPGLQVVGYAETANEAVEAIDELGPELVVTDMRLKEGSGVDVIRRIRLGDRLPRPHIVVLSNYAYPEYKAQTARAGADAFFDKSSEYKRFLALIETLSHDCV